VGRFQSTFVFENWIKCSKLFDVEKLHLRHFLHCSFGGNGAYEIFQHRITFEQGSEKPQVK